MKWILAHKGVSVFLVLAVLYLLSLRKYNENTWSFLLGLVGWAIPIVQIYQRNKEKKWLGRFAPVLSMGACGLAIWMQLHHYLENIEGLPERDIITARGVWIVALFLLVTTALLNLALCCAERDVDTKLEEDHDLTI